MTSALRTTLVATLALALVGLAAPAFASHYRLPAGDLVTATELKSLQKAGVDTTLALYEQAAGSQARKQLARASGLSVARLTELAAQCDLLRVSGVGPLMVRVLQAGGVRHSGDLRKANAAALLDKLRAANQVHKLTEVLPEVEMLQAWIAQAQKLPARLEGVR